MNAPRSKSEKNAIELAKKFLAENNDTFEFAGKQGNWAIEAIAELLLTCHKEGAHGQRINFGWSSDPKNSVIFHEVPFSVTWPVPDQQTLPGEEKKQ